MEGKELCEACLSQAVASSGANMDVVSLMQQAVAQGLKQGGGLR